jgi:hypothetical protein
MGKRDLARTGQAIADRIYGDGIGTSIGSVAARPSSASSFEHEGLNLHF